VVHGEEHHVVVRGAPEDENPPQRGPGEVEGELRRPGRPATELALHETLRQALEVDARHRPPAVGLDDLGRIVVDQGEAGPQGLVAPDDLVQGRAQHSKVQVCLERQQAGQVVGGALGGELVDEPEPLLGEGEREGVA